jgi:hypothetical protein
LKIYKANKIEKIEENFEDIFFDPSVDIASKIKLFIESYAKIKLTLDGFEQLTNRLFSELDYCVHFTRKGDVNERFDVLFTSKINKKKQIVSEIEIPSTAILDAPRNLLDDYAVLVNRRKIAKSNLVPLVICWDLPNNRTDYWNVVKDINKVLSIKIKTCSLLALFLLYWSNEKIDFFDDSFYLDSDNNRLTIVEKIASQYITSIPTINKLGFFAPIK